jgi:hypothetical protein
VRRNVLIADANVDMTEIDDIADILRGTIVAFVLHDGFLSVSLAFPWRFLGGFRGVVALLLFQPEKLACGWFDVLYGGSFCSSGNAA